MKRAPPREMSSEIAESSPELEVRMHAANVTLARTYLRRLAGEPLRLEGAAVVVLTAVGRAGAAITV